MKSGYRASWNGTTRKVTETRVVLPLGLRNEYGIEQGDRIKFTPGPKNSVVMELVKAR